RACPPKTSRRGQDYAHDRERHFPAEFCGICPSGALGGVVNREFWRGGGVMTYSFTQISHYLACPRRYRHRYLDGWEEKDTRAAMLFGRAFEKALAAYFRREDAAAEFFTEWSAHCDTELHYSGNDTWDSMLQQGFQLLDRFAQEDRVRIQRPRRNQQ